MRKIIDTLAIVIIASLFVVFAGGFYVGTQYTDNKIGVDSLQRKVDSLRDENFVLGVELGRWETTIEWYQETYPEEAKKLEDWRSHNTE